MKRFLDVTTRASEYFLDSHDSAQHQYEDHEGMQYDVNGNFLWKCLGVEFDTHADEETYYCGIKLNNMTFHGL